jgi:chromosome segregation ATPase
MTRSSILLALFVLATPGLLAAQKATPARPAASTSKAASTGFDSFILLVPLRDTVTIKKSLKAALEAETSAETRREQAETMRLGAMSRIEAKKVEISRLKERINVAKKENREADRLGMEAERKAAEREIDLLKRRAELREAETEFEARRAELAGLTAKALQLELQLATRRTGRLRTPVGGAGGASQDRVIAELEKQTLEAQRTQAVSSIEVADREITVIDRRLELLDAQERVLGGK